MSSLLIRGGRVLDPARAFDATADVALRDGLVASIETSPGTLDASEFDRVLECDGMLVVPGLVDPHVHLREPGGEAKETIATGTAASVAGGFTTVCCMPNTTPSIDSVATLELVRLRAEETGACRVFAVAAATMGRRGEEIAPIGALARAGAVGISDDGDVIARADMMRRVLRNCATHDRVFMQHCQEPTLTEGAVMNEGDVSTRLGLSGWPKVAEDLIVERDVRLNRTIGARYHAQHVSSGDSVEIIRRARAEGQPVSGEASPHHLLLTDEACDGWNTMAKMNPPLRTQADCDALRAGVADGTITILATDHAPHTASEKARPFPEAPFGIVGIETALALYVEALVDTGAIDWTRLVELMTIEPARLCGLDRHGIGSLAPGGPADVTVIDPDHRWTIDAGAFASKASNTPFDGRAVRGRAVATIVAGDVRFTLDR